MALTDRESLAEPALHSAIYRGSVRHRRHAPAAHAFRLRLYMMYLDLSELEQVFRGRWLWSLERFNVASFRRRDYLGPQELSLDEAVRLRVQQACGRRPSGPIRLLTNLRCLGYCFNPVSFYYCFAEDGETLQAVVAEITNTPWGERHAYVLDAETATAHGSALGWTFDKQFHVSPFLPMQRSYQWRFTVPASQLRVHMDVLAPDGASAEPADAARAVAPSGRQFDATLVLQRRDLDGGQMARVLLRHPWMTLKVFLGIHLHALLIWCKRNPVYDHPQNQPGQAK